MKMKKLLFLVITLMLSAITLFGVGCKPSGGGGEIDPSKITNPPFTMNGFENINDLTMFDITNTFGSISPNVNKDYIKTGSGSAKVVIPNTAYNGDLITSTMKIATKKVHSDEWKDLARSFDKVFLVTLDVYNPNDATVNVRVGIQFTYLELNTSVPIWMTLEPNCWNKIEIPIQREFLPKVLLNKHTGETGVNVEFISILFDRNVATSYTVYVDDLKLYYTDKAVEPITCKLYDDELCSWDEYWEFKKTGISSTGGYLPNLDWTLIDPETNEVSDRKGMLKITTVDRTAEEKDINNKTYSMIDFPAEMFEQCFGDNYGGINKQGQRLVGWDDNDELCIDYFIPEGTPIEAITFTFYYKYYYKFTSKLWELSEGRINAYYDPADPDAPQPVNTYGRWYTARFTVEELNTNRVGQWDETTGKRTYDKLSYTTGASGTFQDLTRIRIEFSSYAGDASTTFYLDNARMERK